MAGGGSVQAGRSSRRLDYWFRELSNRPRYMDKMTGFVSIAVKSDICVSLILRRDMQEGARLIGRYADR